MKKAILILAIINVMVLFACQKKSSIIPASIKYQLLTIPKGWKLTDAIWTKIDGTFLEQVYDTTSTGLCPKGIVHLFKIDGDFCSFSACDTIQNPKCVAKWIFSSDEKQIVLTDSQSHVSIPLGIEVTDSSLVLYDTFIYLDTLQNKVLVSTYTRAK